MVKVTRDKNGLFALLACVGFMFGKTENARSKLCKVLFLAL